jgi:hypothetical protein
MFKKLLFSVIALLVVALVCLLAFAQTKPDVLRVERSITIRGTPEKIYPYIANLRLWTEWSPYEKLDPDMQRTYSGAASGVSAIYSWDGKQAGAGRMEIRETIEPTQILIALDFSKPMAAHNTVEFLLRPSGETTTVTWLMYGPNTFIGKVMCVFVDMDTLLGKDFETGLSNLKGLIESQGTLPPTLVN